MTGCSDGGMGAALAEAFHKAGYKVWATARNPAKMEQLAALGIETLQLDVQSDTSISACVSKLSDLNVLVNNAGTQFLMPVVDVNIAVTQAFLPLLLRSKGIIVNQTSVGAFATIQFQAVYNSSKAALALISDSMRLELQAFGIRVVDLGTGVVKTNLIKNIQDSGTTSLPKGSIYEPAKDVVERALRQEDFESQGMPAAQWAELVVQDLSRKNPPPVIWRGESAFMTRISTVLPFGLFDGFLKKLSGLAEAERILQR